MVSKGGGQHRTVRVPRRTGDEGQGRGMVRHSIGEALRWETKGWQ